MRKLGKTIDHTDVAAALPRLVEAFQDLPELVALYLYGSFDTPRQTPLSDIDLAVLFRPGGGPDASERLRLTGLAVELLDDQDVSLTFLDRAPLPFQHEVLRTGRALLVRDEIALADFKEHVFRYYCDFVIDYRMILADYDEGLRQRYGSG